VECWRRHDRYNATTPPLPTATLNPTFSASSRADTSSAPLSPAVAGHHSTTTAPAVSTAITAPISHIDFGDSSRNRARGAAGDGTETPGLGGGGVASSVMFS